MLQLVSEQKFRKCFEKHVFENVLSAKNKPKNQANLAQDEASSDSEVVMLMAKTSSTGRHDWFIKIDDSSQGKIRFADDSSLNSEGIGRVVLQDSGGREVVIDGVLYVASLKTNLLSLGQLLQKGFIMEMKENGLSVYINQKDWLFIQIYLRIEPFVLQ